MISAEKIEDFVSILKRGMLGILTYKHSLLTFTLLFLKCETHLDLNQ